MPLLPGRSNILRAALVRKPDPMQRKNRSVHTIQQTAKPFKAWQAGGLVLLFTGAVVTVVSDHKPAGIIIFALGLVTYTAARIAAWWHHG